MAVSDRDELIDLLRSVATTTVVLWHWVFTIIVWRPDGPHADNPIGYVSGLWSLTWILQVLPLFFVAGGFVHSLAWAPRRHEPGAWRRFATARLRALGVPALALIAFVGAAGVVIATVHAGPDPWVSRAVLLVLSPLWFLIVYLVLVVSVPLWDLLDRRWGELVPLALGAAAMAVDVARFRYGIEPVAWANMVIVWAACHQVGWSWSRLRAAPNRFGHALMILGLAALVGLTNMGLYPRSMVGTTSVADRFSNMGPPTLPILALCTLQVGLVIANRERILRAAERPRVAAAVDWLSRYSMPLFLWHTVGFAAFYALHYAVTDIPDAPGLAFWSTRPLWLVGPAVLTLPLLAVTAGLRFGRARAAVAVRPPGSGRDRAAGGSPPRGAGPHG